MDNFYFRTREIVSKMRCHIPGKNAQTSLDIDIQYYANPYDGGFIPNTNAPVVFSIEDENNTHHQVSAHGEISIEHSSLSGVKNTFYHLTIEQLLNPFYHTEQAKITSRKNETILKQLFGEKFKTITISTDQQHNTCASLTFENIAVYEISCRQKALTSQRSLYESLGIN